MVGDLQDVDGRPTADSGPRERGGRARWGVLSAVLGLLLWYPATGWPGSFFWGVGGDWPPLDLLDGYLVLLGAGAGSTAAALVVRDGWARLLVVVAAVTAVVVARPALGPSTDLPQEDVLVVGLLVAGALVGLVLGSLLRRSVLGLAVGLAVVAGLATTDRYAGWLVAAAVVVALPGLVLRLRARPVGARLLAGVAGALLALATFLGVRLLAFALAYGWEDARRGSHPASPQEAVLRVVEPMRDFLRAAAPDYLGSLLSFHRTPLLVGAAVAVVGVVVLALVTARPGRPSVSSGRVTTPSR